MAVDDKKNKRSKGGRSKVAPELALSKRVMINLNQAEYDELITAFNDSGVSKKAEYVRQRFFATKHMYVVNPKEILSQLNTIGEEIGRIGKNINQLAKHANTLRLSRDIDPTIIQQLNALLLEYGKERKELAKVIYSFLKRGSEKEKK